MMLANADEHPANDAAQSGGGRVRNDGRGRNGRRHSGGMDALGGMGLGGMCRSH